MTCGTRRDFSGKGIEVMLRLFALFVFALCPIAGCGGAPTRLVTLGKTTGEGATSLILKNNSGSSVHRLFVAKHAAVKKAGPKVLPDSPAGALLWGHDVLDDPISEGAEAELPAPEAGRWDYRLVDGDGRDQHVSGLRFKSGGRYRLELGNNWRLPR